MATSRRCVRISNSEYNKWKAIWRKSFAFALAFIHKRKKKNYASV